MKIKGVFFDLYGTLYKYGNMPQAWNDWLSTLYNNFKIFDKNLTEESLSIVCQGFFSKEKPSIDNSGLSIFENRIKRLSEELNYNIPINIIRKTAEENLNAWQKHITLDEQTIPILKYLKDQFTLGLISNFDHPIHVKKLISKDGIDNYFSCVCISGEVGFKKPDKRIFEIALHKTNLHPEKVIFVGDANDDIEGAKAAGIIPVFINRDLKSHEMLDYNKIEHKHKHIHNKELITIGNLEELKELIKEFDDEEK